MKRAWLFVAVALSFVLGFAARVKVSSHPRPSAPTVMTEVESAGSPESAMSLALGLGLGLEGDADAGSYQRCHCPSVKCKRGSAAQCNASCGGPPICRCAARCKPDGGVTGVNHCACR